VRFFKKWAPNIEVWCAASGVPNPQLSNTVDVWSLNLRRCNALSYISAMEEEREKGVRFSCYANDRYNLALPLLHMRLLGLITAHLRFEGIMWWEVCNWWSDPWKEPAPRRGSGKGRFADAGQGVLLYPHPGRKALCPSLRWLAMIEAADDGALWNALAESVAQTAAKLKNRKLGRNPLIYYFRAMMSGTLAGQFRNDPCLYERLRREAFARIKALKSAPLALTRVRKTEGGFELLVAAEQGCKLFCDGRPMCFEDGLFRAAVKAGFHRITVTRDGVTKTITRLLVEPF